MELRLPLSATVFVLLLAACSTTTTNQADPTVDDKDQGTGGAGASQTGDNLGGSQANTGAGGATADASTSASAGSLGNDTLSGTGGVTSSTTLANKELSCSTYCTLVQSNCLAESVKQYKSMESCVSSCAAFLLGSINDTSGNTLGCRAHYAVLAASDSTLCSAAGPSGGGHCGNNCDAYCALMARVCSTVFDDTSECRTACLKMVGVDEITFTYNGSGDNLQCRIYHATFGAEGFPQIHCPHASPVPQGPCL